MKEIRAKIFQGLKDVFDFYDDAKLSREYFIKPEYLLTVLIAKRLAEKNNDFIIKLEEPTHVFATSSVKVWNNGKFSKNHNPCRNGKIDIAVYSNDGNPDYYPEKPLFPIEIKNINPAKFSYLLDVERNVCFFNIHDDTGGSVIKYAYNISIEEFNNVREEDLDNKIQEIKEKYKKWIAESNLITPNVCYEFYLDKIDCTVYPKNIEIDESEGLTESDFTNDDYCRFGVILELIKNS